jgi:hypothetical protein
MVAWFLHRGRASCWLELCRSPRDGLHSESPTIFGAPRSGQRGKARRAVARGSPMPREEGERATPASVARGRIHFEARSSSHPCRGRNSPPLRPVAAHIHRHDSLSRPAAVEATSGTPALRGLVTVRWRRGSRRGCASRDGVIEEARRTQTDGWLVLQQFAVKRGFP